MGNYKEIDRLKESLTCNGKPSLLLVNYHTVCFYDDADL